MRSYLGIPYLVWGLIGWAAIAGTFGVILLYRLLIAHRPEDESFMSPAEVRAALEHVRHVNRMAVGFGALTVGLLVAIAGAWAFRLLGS
jgi:hypothetical protein